jgi:hypothetical protein
MLLDKPKIGLSLKHQHIKHIISNKPEINWFEVHTENFFDQYTNDSIALDKIAENYDISAHCIGLSLGSADGVRKDNLQNLKDFIDRYKPFIVSDHLSWSGLEGNYVPDLLPVPLGQESLINISDNIKYVQDFLGRQILVENPSSYLSFTEDQMSEGEFLTKIVKNTSCKLILDLNNIIVTSINKGLNIDQYINEIDFSNVGEIHLAGHLPIDVDGHKLAVDDHGSKLYPQLLDLLEKHKKKLSNIPILIEWDNNIPDFDMLVEQKNIVYNILSIG